MHWIYLLLLLCSLSLILNSSKIKQSLSRRGYGGYTSICAYSVKIDFSDEMMADSLEVRIVFVPEEDECERVHRILHDIYLWTLDVGLGYTYCTERLNLIVISNDIQGDISFESCLKYAGGGSCYILLSKPCDIPSGKSECSLWKECHLLHYGMVIFQPSRFRRDRTSLLKRKTRPDTDSQD